MPLLTYEEFEGQVTEALECMIEITRSDAQAIVMAQKPLMDRCFETDKGFEETAILVEIKSRAYRPVAKEAINLKDIKQRDKLTAGYIHYEDLLHISLPEHELYLIPQMAIELIEKLTAALGIRERNKK